MTHWAARFEAFVARKEATARTARLPGYHTVETGRHQELETVGNAWTFALCDGPFFEAPVPEDGLPAVSAVFVQSAGVNTGARHPADLGGGVTDTHVV